MTSRTLRLSRFVVVAFWLAGPFSLVPPPLSSPLHHRTTTAPTSAVVVSAFAPEPSIRSRPRSARDAHRVPEPLAEGEEEDEPSRSSSSSSSWRSRRDVLESTTRTTVAALSGGTLLPWLLGSGEPARAAAPSGPVAVVGASGRTGSLCVTAVRTDGPPAPLRRRERSRSHQSTPTHSNPVFLFFFRPFLSETVERVHWFSASGGEYPPRP